MLSTYELLQNPELHSPLTFFSSLHISIIPGKNEIKGGLVIYPDHMNEQTYISPSLLFF